MSVKKQICYNLLGENPEDVNIYNMLIGLGIEGLLVFCAFYLFIYIPFFYHQDITNEHGTRYGC